VVLFILLVQQGCFASYRASFIDLAVLCTQDEKAEDCTEYPVFALLISLRMSYLPAPLTHEAEAAWIEKGA
jgi:hypothetical protein